jgi:hypothetical protein
MNIKVSMKGGPELRKKLEELAKRYPEAAGAALYQEALRIMAASVLKTPVDTGRLRASAYVGPPEREGGKLIVREGYGVEYAAAVHERTETHHPVGQAKFLESALSDATGDFQENLAARIKENAEKGVGMGALSSDFPGKPPAGS